MTWKIVVMRICNYIIIFLLCVIAMTLLGIRTVLSGWLIGLDKLIKWECDMAVKIGENLGRLYKLCKLQ